MNGDEDINTKGHIFKDQIGSLTNHQKGNKIDYIDGTLTFTVKNDVNYIFHSSYEIVVHQNFTEMIGTISQNGYKLINIKGKKDETIGEYYDLKIIGGNFNIEVKNDLDIKTAENISLLSYSGNILLKTNGDFELLNNETMSVQGFNNLGKKGNIQLISTFGNINLQCIEDQTKADFHEKTVVVPWNPSFVTEMLSRLSMVEDDSNKQQSTILLKGELFFKDIPLEELTSAFSLEMFVDFIKNIMDELIIYDGLPVFLPSKMIIQNPEPNVLNNVDDLTWIPNFRNELKDWRDDDDENIYWKLPGKLMGNINIETWSGDINIKTESTIGCAGNISISASESGGTLPGYKIGTIDIKNNANKRIYPDPRDLFFDSNYEKRLLGQLELFTHGSSKYDKILSSEMRTSVLPTKVDNVLKSILPFSFNWKSLGYDKFYEDDNNCAKILTRGEINLDNATVWLDEDTKTSITDLKDNPAPVLGCTKCISDYLLGLPGIQDVCYATEKYDKIALNGFHKYCFSKFNPSDRSSARGTFNLDSMNYDSLSVGDGHAIEMEFCDKELTGPNMGAINISCAGDFNKYINRNEHKVVNNENPEGRYVVNNVYSEYYYDDKWPEALFAVSQAIGNPWNATIGKLINLREGNFDLSIFGQKIVSTTLNI